MNEIDCSNVIHDVEMSIFITTQATYNIIKYEKVNNHDNI